MNRSLFFTWLLVAAGAATVLTYALIRDIRYEREYQKDLRNRIVGARLLEDGIRYYDLLDFTDYIVSPVTVSPFTLHLLRPIWRR